jgi:hypothetical protein
MKNERSDVEYPMWRKKVDATLLKDGATPIPKWLCSVWSINNNFETCSSKKDPNSNVVVKFNKKKYQGNIVKTKNDMYRLFIDKELCDMLKDIFVMSYIRSIEQELRKNKREYKGQEIENEIPFWEFLDIEFNYQRREFCLKSYYTQKPVYIELFKELVKSHTLKIIEDKLNPKPSNRIVKQDWEKRDRLKNQIDAKNVIYNLIDTNNNLIYIGEAESLNIRLNQNRESIKEWNYYRYDCLPESLTKEQRVAIERLIIRTFASFFPNMKEIPSQLVSEYLLVNQKID